MTQPAVLRGGFFISTFGHAMDQPERWRFKKEISLPDLIALGTALIAVVVAWSTLDKRLALVENALIQEKEARAQVERRVEEQLIRLNDRLDKLLARP